MRLLLAAAGCLALPLFAAADGSGLAGSPDTPASLKPWGNDGAFCGASVETAYPVRGVRVIRGRGPAADCAGASAGQDDRTGTPSVEVTQQVVLIERPYRWRSDFATTPHVLGAPRTRRY